MTRDADEHECVYDDVWMTELNINAGFDVVGSARASSSAVSTWAPPGPRPDLRLLNAHKQPFGSVARNEDGEFSVTLDHEPGREGRQTVRDRLRRAAQ